MKKQIVFSGACLFLATALLAYSSWAWFVSARDVKATGITLDVMAPNNIQISLTGGDDDAQWAEELSINTSDILAAQIADFNASKAVYVLPASTYGGFDGTVFATSRAKNNGEAYEDTVFYNGHALRYTAQSDSYEGHYIDIPLYFRTRDVNGASLYLEKNHNEKKTAISSLDDSDIYKIARVAFLNEEKTGNALGSTLPLVYAEEDRQTASVVTAQTAGFAVPEYITFGTDGFSNQCVVQIPGREDGSAKPKIQKAVLRIWIEGQDRSCTSVMGNKKFSVSFVFTAK